MKIKLYVVAALLFVHVNDTQAMVKKGTELIVPAIVGQRAKNDKNFEVFISNEGMKQVEWERHVMQASTIKYRSLNLPNAGRRYIQNIGPDFHMFK